MSIVQAIEKTGFIFLKRGQPQNPEREEAIRLIQEALLKDGNYNYLVDGDWGAKTDGAIRSFQQEYGLTVDGLVGPKTAELLDKVISGIPLPKKKATIPYADGYINNWNKLIIKPTLIPHIDRVISKLTNKEHWTEYKKLEAASGVPAQAIAIINERESSGSLRTYLGNGQSLSIRTTIVPKGRGPFTGPDAFFKGGMDAFKLEGMVGLDWYDGQGIARLGYFLEKFNGFGYRGKGINSPYLYAGSNIYTSGKYVADGKYDPYHVDTQLGGLVIFKRMVEKNPSLALEAKA